MAPMDHQMMAGGIARSSMMAQYGPPVNRASAHEMLARKLEQGRAAAAAEAQRAEQEKAAAAEAKLRDKEAAARARSQSRTTSSRPAAKSGVEKVLSSPTFWNKVITVGGEIARGMMGTGRKR